MSKKKLISVVLITLLLCIMFKPSANIYCQEVQSKTLVIVPHEDDEALMCAGVIKKQIDQGNSVKVVVATNGDYYSVNTGYKRIKESVDAMALLGLDSSDIEFLGYGDTGGGYNVSFLNKLYNASNDTQIIPSFHAKYTYGINGEYDDYHYKKFGSHGSYTKATIKQDIESIIRDYKPTDIYTTALYDRHGDHMALYKFVVDAAKAIKLEDNNYSPIIYQGLVHTNNDSVWPLREQDNNAVRPFSEPDYLLKDTLLKWEERIISDVPDEMKQLPRSSNNLKYKVINTYNTQGPSAYLDAFVKSDEIFWKQDFSNIALIADVTASSETSKYGQTADKAIDGVVEGYPRHGGNEWASNGELNGAWIKLNWSKSHVINKVVLADRPNDVDHIISGTLTFSDGSTVKVGELPNDGTPLSININKNNITWVKFTVDTAKGHNVGLAEIEVY